MCCGAPKGQDGYPNAAALNCTDCGNRSTASRQAERARLAAKRGKTYRTREQIEADQQQRVAGVARRKVVRRLLRKQLSKAIRRRAMEIKQATPKAQGDVSAWAAKYHGCVAFRLRHLTRYRARSFKRRTGLVMPDDGTVTVEVLSSRADCLYCGTDINPLNASMDHVVALTRGGVHSASNIEHRAVLRDLQHTQRAE